MNKKKLLGFWGLCRAPLTLNFSRAVWVTPPVRVEGKQPAVARHAGAYNGHQPGVVYLTEGFAYVTDHHTPRQAEHAQVKQQ